MVWTGAENVAPHRDSIPGPSIPVILGLQQITFWLRHMDIVSRMANIVEQKGNLQFLIVAERRKQFYQHLN
jgi:hypothetical protein